MTKPGKDSQGQPKEKRPPSLRKEAIKDLATKRGAEQAKGGAASRACSQYTN